MRVLVAGGTGLLGRATVEALREAGHDPVVVSRSATGDAAVQADVGVETPRIEGVDAVVNLVGIAIERGDNTFERAHVDALKNLIALGTKRFIHVTVVRVPGGSGPYFETKARSEEILLQTQLDWTILRPGLVYGEGDDMMTNVVGNVRFAPVFPVPGGEPGPLQVTDVRDVALAVVRALERDTSIHRVYDVVGPDRLSLAELVGKVSVALDLPTWTPALPRPLMRLATRVLETVLPKPPVTSTQLGMLIAGLYGDPQPARRDLDLDGRPLTADRIRELAAAIRTPLPSLRLADAEHLAAGRRAWASPLKWFPLLAVVALLGVTALGLDGSARWLAVFAVYAALAGIAAASPKLPWRRLVRPSVGGIAAGLALAGIMLAVAVVLVPALAAAFPEFVAPAEGIYAWADEAHPALLCAIVLGEDIVWRGAVPVVLAGRVGGYAAAVGAGALFAAGHLVLGPPVLWFAAFLAGTAWSALALRTRSLIPVFLAHLGWDVGMVWLHP